MVFFYVQPCYLACCRVHSDFTDQKSPIVVDTASLHDSIRTTLDIRPQATPFTSEAPLAITDTQRLSGCCIAALLCIVILFDSRLSCSAYPGTVASSVFLSTTPCGCESCTPASFVDETHPLVSFFYSVPFVLTRFVQRPIPPSPPPCLHAVRHHSRSYDFQHYTVSAFVVQRAITPFHVGSFLAVYRPFAFIAS
jgi:hypothetical protein